MSEVARKLLKQAKVYENTAREYRERAARAERFPAEAPSGLILLVLLKDRGEITTISPDESKGDWVTSAATAGAWGDVLDWAASARHAICIFSGGRVCPLSETTK